MQIDTSNDFRKIPFQINCKRCGTDNVFFRPAIMTNGFFFTKAYCAKCGAESGALRTKDPKEFIFYFGKYNGKTIMDVNSTDRAYIEWLSENYKDMKMRIAFKEFLEATKN